MKDSVEVQSGNCLSIAKPTPTTLYFHGEANSPWVFKVEPNGEIMFNREGNPSWNEDEFAREVVRIVEAISKQERE